MIIKLQNGDKLKIESDEKREARRKYNEHSLLSIGLKLKRNLNIAYNFLKEGPNATNFGNAISALFGGYSPENPDLHYGEAPGVGIKNFANLVKTARVAREFNDVVKGPVNQFKLLNNFIEKFVTNPKGSGKLIHYDKGNGKSIYQENRGASIINNKLIPGKTKREGLKDYTWWNTDNPYMNVHKAKDGPFSPTRYIVVDDNTQFKHPFDLKEPVGQSAGKGKGFIIKTERVTDKPVDLTNAEIYEKSPFGWWERIKVLSTPEIIRSKPYVRWSLEGYLNEAYDIDGGPGLKFQVVKDVDNPLKGVLQTKGNNQYSLHFKSSRNNPNKEGMFQALAESIPEGGIVSTWGKITKGGYHAINRFGEQFGWPKVGERSAVNGPVNMFLKPKLDLNKYNRLSYLIGDEYGIWEETVPSYVNKRIEKLRAKLPNIFSDYKNSKYDDYFLSVGFTPKVLMRPGKNLKALLYETERRLNNVAGVDEDRNLALIYKGLDPYYLGYFDVEGTSGMHNVKRGISMIEPNPHTKMANDMMHEGISHGTDRFMPLSVIDQYQAWVDNIMNSPYIKDNTFKSGFRTYKINKGSDKWYEARATIGELRKIMYDKIAKLKGITISKETLPELRPEFEKQVDNMSLEDASKALKDLEAYGLLYGEVGPKTSPSFLRDFKTLLKFMPATVPFLIPRKEEKK